MKNLPNIITFTRLILIVPFSYLLFINFFSNIVSFIILMVFVLTDFLDGYIARKYNLISSFGKILDPIADKLLVVSVTVALILNDSLPIYSLFIFIRDIVINGLGIYLMTKNNIVVGSNMYGKVKTVCHFFALGLVVLTGTFGIFSLLLLLIGFLTMFPEILYGIKFYKGVALNEKTSY